MDDEHPQVMNPPASRRMKVNWYQMVEYAKAHPGQWVRTPMSLNPAVAAQIRRGMYASVDPTEFEVTTRIDHEDGDHAGKASWVYIRTRGG